MQARSSIQPFRRFDRHDGLPYSKTMKVKTHPAKRAMSARTGRVARLLHMGRRHGPLPRRAAV